MSIRRDESIVRQEPGPMGRTAAHPQLAITPFRVCLRITAVTGCQLSAPSLPSRIQAVAVPHETNVGAHACAREKLLDPTAGEGISHPEPNQNCRKIANPL